MTLSEPDVALTDFGLAMECVLFAAWLYWRASSRGPLQRWFVVLFVALGIGALLGAVAHGFIAEARSAAARMVWAATLVGIGVAAVASWAVGAHMLMPARSARWVVAAAVLLFVLNVAVVLAVSQSFLVAIAFYAPAVAFVLVAFVLAYGRTGESLLLPGIAGVVLSLVAAIIQQSGTGFPALGLGHNALYHVVQAVGLALVFVSARRLAEGASDPAQPDESNVSRETN